MTFFRTPPKPLKRALKRKKEEIRKKRPTAGEA